VLLQRPSQKGEEVCLCLSVLSSSSSPSSSPSSPVRWQIDYTSSSSSSSALPPLFVSALIAADGEAGRMAEDLKFPKKILRGASAIGITSNFVNTGGKEERGMKEFGALRGEVPFGIGFFFFFVKKSVDSIEKGCFCSRKY